MTAKEITLNYLKSIQKDLKISIDKFGGINDNRNLKAEYIAIAAVIQIIEESEGE